jgi:hypothetical protein
MATISYAVPASGGHPAIRNLAYLMEVVVDFAVVAGDVTIGTTDTVQVLKIPAGSLVLSAGVNVKTAETTNTTAKVSLGDGSDTARYVDAGLINATGSITQAATLQDGKYYDAADTIDLLISVDDPVNGVVSVWAVVADFTDLTTADKKTYTSA